MSIQALTEKQAHVLRFVREASASSLPPTIREVMNHLGLTSPRGAEGHLKALVNKGYLTHFPRTSRSYRLKFDDQRVLDPGIPGDVAVPSIRSFAANQLHQQNTDAQSPRIPVLGRVPAGFPSHQETQDLGEVRLPIHVSHEAFAVCVSGDSMCDAHILDGDLAVGDPTVQPSNRSVVIAVIDGEFTIKAYRKTAQGWWLEPANENYSPILPRLDDDRIHAVVVAIVRTRIGQRPLAARW